MKFLGGYKKFKEFLEKYERILIPGMLLSGVIADFFTFTTIKINIVFIILTIYLFAAGIAIIVLNLRPKQRFKIHEMMVRYIQLISPFVLQFTFGALLSSSLVFYWFSGAFSVSWPIMLILAGLMISNDVLRHYYTHPVIQISVYFFTIFSLSSLMFPYIFSSISPLVFLLAGIGSLVIILVYIVIFLTIAKHQQYLRSSFIVSIMAIFVVMNGLYFLNIIPPIPLSIREMQVAHNIDNEGGEYRLLVEEKNSIFSIISLKTIHVIPNEDVYMYVSVFAPAKISTDIVHVWEKWDDQKNEWKEYFSVSYPIIGGREGGYRGFSFSEHVSEGKWRVIVETERGQILGNMKFNIEFVEYLPILEEVIR